MSVDSSANTPPRINLRNHVGRQAWSCSKNFFERLILRKQMGLLQAEIDIDNQLRRSVTILQLIGIGVGSTIGTGIFVLSGQAAAQYSGPSIIISFIIAGIVTLLSALSMSEMSSMMASSGSAYTYIYVALGEYPAFMIGWLSALIYLLAASTVCFQWSHYVVYLIDLISDYNVTGTLVQSPTTWSEPSAAFYGTGQVINLPAIAITIAIIFVLFIGIRETAIANLVFVVIKVIILLIFIFACCPHVDRKNYDPFFPSNDGKIP